MSYSYGQYLKILRCVSGRRMLIARGIVKILPLGAWRIIFTCWILEVKSLTDSKAIGPDDHTLGP